MHSGEVCRGGEVPKEVGRALRGVLVEGQAVRLKVTGASEIREQENSYVEGKKIKMHFWEPFFP